MYWLASNELLDLIPWLLSALTWSIGGVLLSTFAFDLDRSERIFAGFGIGLISYLFFANIFNHFLGPELAFTIPSALFLAAAILLTYFWKHSNKGSSFYKEAVQSFADQTTWIWFLIAAGLFVGFLLISRGLAIFDEPKNLTLTSLMAVGDIPPHYYMNADFFFRYHYGFQLLSASLMRLGGFFPWSAFDIAKAIVFSLAIITSGLIGKRMNQRWSGAVLMMCVLAFGSGMRYLLLLYPPEFLADIDSSIHLIGTSAMIELPFSQALHHGWSIQGGPPVDYPFASINGILPPIVMSHNGTTALSVLILLLLILLVPKQTTPGGTLSIAILLATWALTWESSYALFVVGGALAGWHVIWREGTRWRGWFQSRLFRMLGIPILISIPLALAQGGVFTEILRGMFFNATDSGIGVEGAVKGLGFTFRWPLAIVSAHFSPLSLFNIKEVLTAIPELGFVIFLIPMTTRWVIRRRSEEQSESEVLEVLLISSWVGFLLPIFLVYPADRDITRFSSYALRIWLLLLVWMILDDVLSTSRLVGILGKAVLILSMVSGCVILIVELSAVSHPVIGFGLTGMDARISRDYWDKLETGYIYDPGHWRASALTGLQTRAAIGNQPTEEWLSLYNKPTRMDLQLQGFRYVYVDEVWWNHLESDGKSELSAACIQVMAEYWDAEHEHFRRLLDIGGCKR